MKRIGIIGAGFSGIMTAVHCIRNATFPIEIFLFDEKQRFHRGIAYQPASTNYILNVPSARMSAFHDESNHFLNWYIWRYQLNDADKVSISKEFLPRHVYGSYLNEVWKEAQTIAESRKISVHCVSQKVKRLVPASKGFLISTDHNLNYEVDECVLATGNHLPGNPSLADMNYIHSPRYFRNPWDLTTLTFPVNNHLPVCIIGNGLTMAETVIGLRENGFKGVVNSISPNGFQILPNRLQEVIVPALNEQLQVVSRLLDVLRILNKWKRNYFHSGISFEPLIATLRPHVHRMWIGFSVQERKFFMSRLRHAWGVARHRIAPQVHEQLSQLRIQHKLNVVAGRLISISDAENSIEINFKLKKSEQVEKLIAQCVINCTGPETNLSRMSGHFLHDCFVEGLLSQDDLQLGLRANTESFVTINRDGYQNRGLFTIGPNLKGELWESTAVNEIRQQAQRLAEQLVK